MSTQTTISNLMKMAENSPKWGYKILLEKEAIELRTTSTFPVFSKDLNCRHMKTCLGKG